MADPQPTLFGYPIGLIVEVEVNGVNRYMDATSAITIDGDTAKIDPYAFLAAVDRFKAYLKGLDAATKGNG